MNAEFIDVGHAFGAWTVTGVWKIGGLFGKYVSAECDCGATKSIPMIRFIQKNRPVRACKACGRLCGNVRHGMHATPEYRAWQGILNRCHKPNDSNYHRYGARGITVCPEWRNSFDSFLSDMGRRPSAEHSIERNENNGPYSPSNCRWATQIEQSRNRRSNVYIEFRGERKCVREWEKILGMRIGTIRDRLKRGWSIEDSCTQLISRRKLSER